MSGTFNKRGELEPSAAAIIGCIGRKGSGKSIMAMMYLRSWPYDAVVVDVAGDDGPHPHKIGVGTHDVFDLRGSVDELPHRWPEELRHEGRPMILRYLPDAGSPTELEDMDAAVALAYQHSDNPQPCMLVIHEIGRVAPANRTPPHMRRVLNHSRHRRLTMVYAGPRPQTIDPLVLAQADVLYVFELQNPADRRRIAESIGWDPRDFDAAVDELRAHEYLRHDAREPKPESENEPDLRLIHFPALPEDVVAQTKRWSQGDAYQHKREARIRPVS